MAKKTNCVKNGKEYYRITISIGRDSEGRLIRKEFYGSNKKDAESKKESYLNGINKGLDSKHDKILLGVTMKIWLQEVVKNASKPSTYDRYEGIYRNYIENSSLFHLNISEIKPLQIQRYYNDLFNKKQKSSSSINTLNKLLKSFFTFAVNQGYILNNPCTGKKITIPGNLKTEKKNIEIFEDEEIKKILASLEDSKIKSISLVCLATGMRRGECLGLKWSDINFKTKEIHIERSCKTVAIFDKEDNKKYMPILQIPKTLTSVRTIPLPKSITKLLKSIKNSNSKEKLKAGTSYNDNDLVFCNPIGNLLDDSNIDRSWKRFLKRCGVKEKNLHALRHTYATKQFENGVPLKTVSYLLGHSDIYITANRYTHVLKKHKEKSVDILSII